MSENPGSTRGAFEDFLNPKSMITPGVAGGLTMAITNSLCAQFGLLPNYTALIISFLFGLLVFLSRVKVGKLQRGVYFVLNSLIIFSVAVGANQAGVTDREGDASLTEAARGTRPFFVNWLDGTVPRREALAAEADDLSEEQARVALERIIPRNDGPVDSEPTGIEDPRDALTRAVRTARTAEAVEEFEAAFVAARDLGFDEPVGAADGEE